MDLRYEQTVQRALSCIKMFGGTLRQFCVDDKGTVANFNAANPGNEIAAGDFIIRTAGLKKDGPKMLEYIRKKHDEAQEGPCTIDCTVWRNLSG